MRFDESPVRPKRFPALWTAEKDKERRPCNIAMKRRWSSSAAVVAAGLLIMMQVSPSAAETPCEALARAVFAHAWLGGAGGENPIKPQNVWASLSTTSLNVGWDVPSTRPAGTVTGQCVHLTHNEAGASKEWCGDETDDSTIISATNCLAPNNCPLGDYTVKVKLRNNCGATESWSDSIVSEKTTSLY